MNRILKTIMALLMSFLFMQSLLAEQAADFSSKKFIEELQQVLETKGMNAGLALFDKIPEEFKEDSSLNILKASLLLSSNKVEEASDIGKKLMAKEPSDIDVLFLNAMIAKAKNNHKENISLLEKILKIDEKNADANAELGNEQLLSKNYQTAKRYFLTSLATDASNPTALLGYGQVCYYDGSYKDAENSLNKLIKQDSYNSLGWAYLAKVYGEQGKYGDAIASIEKSIKIEPDYFDFWIDYGMYLKKTDNMDKALNAWTKAVELKPDYFLGYVYRAGMYEYFKKDAEALDDYRQIAKLNPGYPYSYEQIGVLAFQQGFYKESREAFEKVYKDNPQNVSYPLMISATYLKEKNLKDGKAFVTKALKNYQQGTVEYSVMRLFYDFAGDAEVLQKVASVTDKNIRGKLMFYMAFFYEYKGNDSLAQKYYVESVDVENPMYFEHRLAKSSLNTKWNFD